MIERRLKEPITNLNYNDLLGAKVKVINLSMSNGLNWNEPNNKTYTIDKIYFRVSVDGNCYTVIELKEKPGLLFRLGEIILCQDQETK